MNIEFQRRKRFLAEVRQESIENIPDYKVKTPLQRVVQLLKRHRDIRFGDNENKPISIILTTLSAQAYDNEVDIYDALRNILTKMDSLIKKDDQGNFLVINPVNPLENFADKWNETKEKSELFFDWLYQAKRDFEAITGKRQVEIAEILKPVLGEKIVRKAFVDLGEEMRIEREKGNLYMATSTGILSSVVAENSIKL